MIGVSFITKFEVFEMGVRLALGHRTPGTRFEQLFHVLLDGAAFELVAGFAQLIETVAMVRGDVVGSACQVGEDEAVGREHRRDVAEGLHAVEAVKKLGQRGRGFRSARRCGG